MQDLDKLMIGETVCQILDCDLRLEQAAPSPGCATRSRIARACAILSHATSSCDILEGEEEHVDFIEMQLGLIDRIGMENYIQLQSGSAE